MPGLDVEQVRRQYETVRHDAATQVAFSRPGYGLTLLMTRGMPAWLETVSTVDLPPVALRPRTESDGLELAPPVRSELARVLASLVFRCVPEGASP